MAFLMMRTLASVEPDALIWYLKTYSLDQLIVIFILNIGSSPMVSFSFSLTLLSALLFGFLTELGLSMLRKIPFLKKPSKSSPF